MPTLPSPGIADPDTRVRALISQYPQGLLGVPPGRLRLTWQVESSDPAAAQIGYQLRSASRDAAWTELEPVAGSASIAVPLPGRLPARARQRIAVRIATDAGWTPWSAPLTVETGILGEELDARVIAIPSSIEGPVAILRREFDLAARPEAARLRASALGLVDVWINGTRATDALLTPGWTAYQRRVLLDTYDVTDLLTDGRNVIVLAVADGWFRGRVGFTDRTAIYGAQSGALAQLEIDGDVVLVTDTSWRGGFGSIQAASIYDGTTIDLRRQPAGLHQPGFDDAAWVQASIIDTDPGLFEPRSAPPVRVVAELPMAVERRTDRILLDARQNISGWVRLIVDGKAGDVVTIRHAEVLTPAGELHTEALRSAKATDVYILDRDGRHVLEPAFTFHGFQYADVVGADVVAAVAVAISSDLPRRSHFRSSHQALDQFHSNVFWSQRDNFVSLPTDCPQRDERLGWTGDAQAFAATASTLMDTEAFWGSWLRDLDVDQTDAQGVPGIVPNIFRVEDSTIDGEFADSMGRAGWADAATIVPFAVYESFGSDEVLRVQLSSMRRWIAHLRRRAGDAVLLPTEPFQFGDWLDPDAPPGRPWEAKVSSDYVANAFYAHSVRLLARAEHLVGDAAAGRELTELAERVAAETWAAWGEAAARTHTGAALALVFAIAPDGQRAAIADALAERVRQERGRISTGFLGTPLVLFALSRSGYLAEAYLMLLRREAPSWLYQVDRGATTVWERWDAILPDGSIHGGEMDSGSDGGMLSFNHYAYGAMIDWVYRTVAGLAPDLDDPGYRTTHVAPRPAAAIRQASATIETRLGRLAIDWSASDDLFEAALTVPFGARAVLDLPVTESSDVQVDGEPAPAELRHGTYRITVTHPAIRTDLSS